MSDTDASSRTDVKTGSSSVKPHTVDGGPIIEESQESEEYQQDLQVVVGTTIGVIVMVGLVVVAVLLYRLYRSRQRALAYIHHNDDSLDRNISIDLGEKCQPVVLLLYANDCQLHQRVVEALAGFLMEVCSVTITLDLLEESDIIDRGIDDWLVDRLQEADYIMVLCSLGARLRCSKKYVRFKSIGQQLLPDYFSIAVDYVSEKMRVEKQKGLGLDKFIVVYMDYSTQSDIPPQLETASRFCLMRDIHKLHTHFKTIGPESVKSDSGSQQSDCEMRYHETETGAVLKATIEQTKTYFKDNPSWMDDRLETASVVPQWVGKSRKRQHRLLEQPFSLLTNSLPLQSVHEVEMKHPQYPHRWSSKLSESIDMLHPASLSMVDIIESQQLRKKGALSSSGMFQGRQNSLPSSLAGSGSLSVPNKTGLMSKSMDNFCTDSHHRPDHEGIPCLFCGNCHLEGVPECRLLEPPESLPNNPNQGDSVHNLYSSLNNCSHSQTILQAEVHQEWGTPVKNYQRDNNKSNTFGGDVRVWESNPDLVPQSFPVYKSLPSHHPPLSEWENTGKLYKWDSPVLDSSKIGRRDKRQFENFHHSRTLSQSSVLTSESESASDSDSLKRDLNSIQNISSFQDFINSSLFVTPRTNERLPNHYFLPPLSPSHLIKPLSNMNQQENQNNKTPEEIELAHIQTVPLELRL